ncbi:MAG: nucleoside-diphosphate kinase [Chlorobiaceae bacterium]|nr:MAG: nucleoside-diphosphate kinase [Chloroflexota bacterium]MBA4313250.1 nucleoside-diphosphate kinase [Chlorobiaceae bacterium]
MERTLVLIKPDGVQRNLMGEIITRLELRGLKAIAVKFILVSEELAREHYKIHVGKPFYEGLVQYITSAPLLAMVWEGPQAISAVRQTMGATNPVEAAPGTIRHDFALVTSRNLTHASDSLENSAMEIATWFSESELFPWERVHENWFTGKN